MGRISSTLLAHEWIAKIGGSENVFAQIRNALPAHRAFCLWNDNPGGFSNVAESWLARSPLRNRKAAALLAMPGVWKNVDLAGADRVLVSSHVFAHHLAGRAAAAEIPAYAYVHTPARYVWAPELDARGRSVGRMGREYFRRLDRRGVHPDVKYAANSRFVAKRIARCWGVEADVIYPPVDVARIRAHSSDSLSAVDLLVVESLPNEFVLGASRFIPYKRLEAAIQAGEVLGVPVVLAGNGPDESRLRALAEHASVPAYFVGSISDELLIELYHRALLFVYMGIEDFGIMPVEAMAAGTPVLVNSVGGAAESVVMAEFGVATEVDDGSLREKSAVMTAVSMGSDAVDQSILRRFSSATFQANISAWVGNRIASPMTWPNPCR